MVDVEYNVEKEEHQKLNHNKYFMLFFFIIHTLSDLYLNEKRKIPKIPKISGLNVCFSISFWHLPKKSEIKYDNNYWLAVSSFLYFVFHSASLRYIFKRIKEISNGS